MWRLSMHLLPYWKSGTDWCDDCIFSSASQHSSHFLSNHDVFITTIVRLSSDPWLDHGTVRYGVTHFLSSPTIHSIIIHHSPQSIPSWTLTNQPPSLTKPSSDPRIANKQGYTEEHRHFNPSPPGVGTPDTVSWLRFRVLDLCGWWRTNLYFSILMGDHEGGRNFYLFMTEVREGWWKKGINIWWMRGAWWWKFGRAGEGRWCMRVWQGREFIARDGGGYDKEFNGNRVDVFGMWDK